MIESTPLGQLAFLALGAAIGCAIKPRRVHSVVVATCGSLPFLGYGFTEWFC
jgi:hypothetical protein